MTASAAVNSQFARATVALVTLHVPEGSSEEQKPAGAGQQGDGRSGPAVTLTLSRSQNDWGLRKLNAMVDDVSASVTRAESARHATKQGGEEEEVVEWRAGGIGATSACRGCRTLG